MDRGNGGGICPEIEWSGLFLRPNPSLQTSILWWFGEIQTETNRRKTRAGRATPYFDTQLALWFCFFSWKTKEGPPCYSKHIQGANSKNMSHLGYPPSPSQTGLDLFLWFPFPSLPQKTGGNSLKTTPPAGPLRRRTPPARRRCRRTCRPSTSASASGCSPWARRRRNL